MADISDGMNNRRLKIDAFPVRRPGVLKQGPHGQLIIFNSDSGQYFALDEIGSFIWERCDGAHAISEMIADLCEQYDAPSGLIENDLRGLMTELVARNLLASPDLFQNETQDERTTPPKTAIRRENVPLKGPVAEKVGIHKSSGKILFKAKYLEDGREVEKLFYDEDGNVTKKVQYEHDHEPGYKMMEVFNGRGRILLRHERGKPPEHFDL
ncbi:MAG TPA: PqqD family peptide modification chaperone [Candidatus Saccharimonadales bacterium]|nr:PqqD family peptide modification chaperone [Candidatus Saccharimonadales bacterium]